MNIEIAKEIRQFLFEIEQELPYCAPGMRMNYWGQVPNPEVEVSQEQGYPS